MGSSSIVILRLISLLLILSSCYCLEWDISNYPNPTSGDFKRCNMQTASYVCDPDEVLTETQRHQLNHELHQLESRTRQENAPDFCQRKGITAALAIARHIRGNSETVKDMANQILRKWTLDGQCQKSVVFLVAVKNNLFWTARDSLVPVYAQNFTDIFNSEKQFFKRGDYFQALGNIIRQIRGKALSKRGISSRSRNTTGGSIVAKMLKALLSRIPFWLRLKIILAILALVCCCFCLYYCCCRCRNNSQKQGPTDIESGGGIMPTGDSGRDGGDKEFYPSVAVIDVGGGGR